LGAATGGLVVSTPLILAGALPGAGGELAAAAAVAVAIASRPARESALRHSQATLLVEVGGGHRRGPTMLASHPARELECALRETGINAAARGRLTWLGLGDGPDWLEQLGVALDATRGAGAAIVCVPRARWRDALEADRPSPSAILIRAELPAQRALAALTTVESLDAGLPIRIATRAPGRVAGRRALAGIDPGGETSIRYTRLAEGLLRRLAHDSGQALPLALGGILALLFCALLLTAFGGAVTGKSRVQRAADLAALSAARSMRDDFERLFAGPRRPDGSPNPRHLSKPEYLQRALAAALEAGRRNRVAPRRLRVEFPDADSFAPLRVRAEVTASLDLAALPALPVAAHAEAQASVPATASAPASAPAMASGGGYSGRLEYRTGEPMRPDVASAFDRMADAAAAAGLTLIVNSGFRSDAEQAALFAQNPDPTWVAPPGTSLHRCATELDLGPPSAYAWLAAHAARFGFARRYAWESWHYGFVAGPAPCSAQGDLVGAQGSTAAGGDGPASAATLPAFVPARFRQPLLRASARWNVSAALLAAQLMAESNFNPFAVSPAGAQGIAQFMPTTAQAYGLADPFDPAASIDAQAHLMSDLLEQFGSVPLALAAYNAGPAPVAACDCVPSYPETQAYVTRILALMRGAGAIVVAPVLEVRLVD
jgi:soluble lytic murein transglycosylase-like protein